MKKAKLLIAIIISACLLWYLFLKPQDYIVRFEVKTSPGTVYKGLEDWNLINKKTDSFTYVINEKKPFSYIHETIKSNNRLLNLNWSFKSINDSITKVVVGITEKESSIFNRITIPFFNTEFKKKTISIVQDYKQYIEIQLKENIKIKYIGEQLAPQITYAYLELKNIDMHNKAALMIEKNDMFISFLNENNLKDGDLPFLIVNNWNIEESKINFRYCFPINIKDTFPFHKEIKFDKTQSTKALKAIYNGNYATSDRAWFAIYEHAKRHNIEIENSAIEFFLNNPFSGGKEITWKTEIYMPLVE